jgi:CRISPR system Cascade subunit CasB
MNEGGGRPLVRGRYRALYDFVEGKLRRLRQPGDSRNPAITASLARLRQSIGTEPGSDPAIWGQTLAGMPCEFEGDDLHVTAEEHAVHAALGLYALHQQARAEPMHVRGVSMGRACSRLARATGNEVAVSRRFQALATASGLSETLHHARSLVGQLRAQTISMDYALFAVDIARLQFPGSADRVRLSWGRDYYFRPSADSETENLDANGTATTTTGEQE